MRCFSNTFLTDVSYKNQKANNDLDEELKKSGDKIKEIAESFKLDPHYNPHRKSGSHIVDFLDEKTLAHLEELKIIDPHSSCDKPYIDKPYIDDDDDEVNPAPLISNNSRQHTKGLRIEGMEDFADHGGGTSGPDYLEISKKVCVVIYHLYFMEDDFNDISAPWRKIVFTIWKTSLGNMSVIYRRTDVLFTYLQNT